MGVDLALVLIGGEETNQPSRNHSAQVTENSARLMYLKETKHCMRLLPSFSHRLWVQGGRQGLGGSSGVEITPLKCTSVHAKHTQQWSWGQSLSLSDTRSLCQTPELTALWNATQCSLFRCPVSWAIHKATIANRALKTPGSIKTYLELT